MPENKKLFVKCDNCGKHIVIGEDEYYKKPGYSSVYCSPECYHEAYDDYESGTMTLDEADTCCCEVYEDHPVIKKTVEVVEGGPRKLSPEEIEKLLEEE